MQKQQIAEEKEDQEEKRLYTNFIYSIKSEVTRELYLKCIKYYIKFLGVKNYKDIVLDRPQ